MASETASSVDEVAVSSPVAGGGGGGGGGADTRGRHRILAELKRVEQDSRFLEVTFFFFIIYCCCFSLLGLVLNWVSMHFFV